MKDKHNDDLFAPVKKKSYSTLLISIGVILSIGLWMMIMCSMSGCTHQVANASFIPNDSPVYLSVLGEEGIVITDTITAGEFNERYVQDVHASKLPRQNMRALD